MYVCIYNIYDSVKIFSKLNYFLHASKDKLLDTNPGPKACWRRENPFSFDKSIHHKQEMEINNRGYEGAGFTARYLMLIPRNLNYFYRRRAISIDKNTCSHKLKIEIYGSKVSTEDNDTSEGVKVKNSKYNQGGHQVQVVKSIKNSDFKKRKNGKMKTCKKDKCDTGTQDTAEEEDIVVLKKTKQRPKLKNTCRKMLKGKSYDNY